MMKSYWTRLTHFVWSGALLMALMAVPVASHAQTVTLFGALGNFDVLNDTGQDANGFEIELDGITPQQVVYEFNWTRYGASQIIPILGGGAIVRWQSPWDPVSQRFTTATTPPAVFAPTLGHSCVGTAIVGCDHYGVTLAYYSVPPTATKYYWLVADPNNLGQLMRFGGAPVQIPQPIVTVIPPPQAGNPPQVAFQIQADPPPPPPVPKPVPQYGEAKWVKVYKTELDREVGLDELVNDNPIVPQDPGKLETAWKLLQFNPNTNGNSGILRNQGGVNSGSRSVLRRYEFYKYSGAYDPLDHSAQCADGTCTAPSPTELGDFIGDQNAAANVGVPSVTVTRNGNGTVTGANGRINCGGSCSTTTNAGDLVTLTASPASNAVFTGWGGACAGTQTTCTIAVADQMNVTANFTTIFTLSIGRSGNGTVTATPAGVDRALNCGSACSAKFLQGTTVTLTATPAPGLSFVSWTNGCVSSTPTCTLVIGKDTTAQANFK